jgi:hypothetical protein
MKVLELILENAKFVLITIIMVMFMLLLRQCNSTKNAKDEIIRINNNTIALNDTIKNYKDKWGNSIGVIRGLTLKLDELSDSIEYERNKPPVTIISYITEIRDSLIFVPVVDSITMVDSTLLQRIAYVDTSEFNKSSRIVSFTMPVWSKDTIRVGETKLNLSQNIWLEASISKDRKSKEVYVHLKTDYPGVIFNDTQGILIQNDKELKKLAYSQRKQFGLGLQIGVGYSGRIMPYIGVGVHYSPKFLQW